MSGRLVYIVEDSPDLAANLEIACGAIPDVEVRVAGSAEQAWEMLQSSDSAEAIVVVTDVRLPETDGVELIRRIRADRRLAQVPVVVVSGEADPETAGRLRELAISARFHKPYSPVSLRKQVQALLDAQP
ncbi:MAG: response regulator [Bryobacteraceae bacterium]|nr:response regulator [Bryobacteraceae bacterium]